MALSAKQRKLLDNALGNKKEAESIANAIDSGSNVQASHVANISTADATDLASAEVLANASKAKINELLAALQAAGLMA